jgi:hypothetical protein
MFFKPGEIKECKMALKLRAITILFSASPPNSRDVLMISLNSPVMDLSEDELLARNVRNFIVPRIFPTSNLVRIAGRRRDHHGRGDDEVTRPAGFD